jgi:hypothetical protein
VVGHSSVHKFITCLLPVVLSPFLTSLVLIQLQHKTVHVTFPSSLQPHCNIVALVVFTLTLNAAVLYIPTAVLVLASFRRFQ